MNNAPGAAGGRFWLLIGDVPNGPFDVAQIHAKLLSGTITWQSQACPVGGNTWLPLVSVPGLGPGKAPPSEAIQAALPVDQPLDVIPVALPVEPTASRRVAPALPPAVGEERGGRKPTRAWNPVGLAWLGLIFSPVWAGIMAALNGRRLGLSLPVWRPITIGVGSFLLALVNDAVFDAYWLHVLLYLGALGLIWFLDLRPQAKTYALHPERAQGATGWVVPALAGAPAALLVFLAFVVAPLIPLEPREVCQKFAAAKTEKEMKKYTTINLWPALAVLARQQDAEDSDAFELTDEGPAPEDVGGYLVGFRGMFKDGKEQNQIEGVFHLVHWQGEWKIEDMYLTGFNRQPLENWVSLAKNYQQIAASSPGKPPVTTAPARPSSRTEPSRNQASANPLNSPGGRAATTAATRGVVYSLLHGEGKPIGKALGVVLVAVVAGLCRFGKGLLALFNPASQDKQPSA